MTLRRWLKIVLMFPAMSLLGIEASPESSVEEDVSKDIPLPETVVSEIPKPDGISDEEWEGLAEAEREAMHITGDQVEADEKAAAGDLSDEDLDGVLGELGGEEKPEGEKKEDERGKGGEVAVDTDIPTDEDLLSFRATVADSELTFSDEVPAETQTKLDALDAKIDDAEKWFDDGEKPDGTPFIRADLNKLNREVAKEREAVNREIMQYQIKQRDNTRESLVWEREQAAFIKARSKDYAELETDGKTFTDRAETLFGALTQQVNKLLKDPAWSNKPGMALMIEGDKRVRKALGLPAPGSKKAESVPEKKPVEKPPAAQRPNVKTLAGAPSAAENESNPYANIMNLKGEAYLEAIENMTEKQRNAFEKWNAGR